MEEAGRRCFAVIMAGGRGTRFWPRSRRIRPKQLLDIVGDSPMVLQTVERAEHFTSGPSDIIIVAEEANAKALKDCVPRIPDENVLVEPVGRNTAACIGLAAEVLALRDPDSVMVVLPADHAISDVDAFARTIREAVAVAGSTGALVTLGIRPAGPDTGYGYIHAGSSLARADGIEAFRVERFVEKPDLQKAQHYFAMGDYYWNSGMFIWRVSSIQEAIERHLPDLNKGLKQVGEALVEGKGEIVERVYPTLESISIDYGVMEKATEAVMIPASFSWNDVGAWDALDGVLEQDPEGNIVRAPHYVGIDTHRCILHSNDRLLTTIGLEDVIVVDTGDAVLVCPKNRAQDVKTLVESLEAKGLDKFL